MENKNLNTKNSRKEKVINLDSDREAFVMLIILIFCGWIGFHRLYAKKILYFWISFVLAIVGLIFVIAGYKTITLIVIGSILLLICAILWIIDFCKLLLGKYTIIR